MTIFLYISLCWLAITLLLAFMENGKTITVHSKSYCKINKESAYDEYLNIEAFYTKLNKGHQLYSVQNNNWENGGKIKVVETAGFQMVTHHYKIKERIPNELVHLVSEESKVEIFGLIKGTNKSEAIFTFEDDGKGSILGLTITITFPNRIRQILASSFFTKFIWQRHATMEMKQLSHEIEKRCQPS